MGIGGLGILHRSKTAISPPRSAAERRAARIATPDLSMWAEQALTSIGRTVRDWHGDDATFALQEAEMGAEALLAVIRELRRRTGR